MFAAQTATVTLKLASIFSASKIRTVLIREINWFVVETDVCLGVTSPDEAVLWIPIRPGERAWKSPHARKGDTHAGVCVSRFLAWGDFHARSRFARSTIPEEKWGTTRSLGRWIRIFFFPLTSQDQASSLRWIFKTVRAKKNLRIQKYPDTWGHANSICIRIRVDFKFFVSWKKKSRL